MFQYRHYNVLAVMSNTAVCVLIGWMLGDYIGAFALCWGVRLFFSYHLTFFINSLAHYWGEQSYSKELSARDNAILALLTVDEGYHNYHHTFPADYRNGIKSFHFDPVKWTVWTMHKLGLANSLRTYTDDTISQRLIRLDTALLTKQLAQIEQHPETFREILFQQAAKTREALELKITLLAETLYSKRQDIAQLIEEKRTLRKGKMSGERLQAVKAALKAKRQAYREDWRN